MHNSSIVCLLFGFLSVFSVHSQEYYRWFDKSGQLHVSQTPPPPGLNYEIMQIQANGAATASAVQPATQTPAQPAPASNSIAELNKQVEQMNVQVRQHNCQQAQMNKQRLTEEAVLMVTDSDGKPIELSAEMRAEQLDIAEKQIKEFCQ